ncbi:hypothetical protein RRG08_035476 [Elysia crispata]|uniref:Major facilitator superfamily (MFS) profile domain-containing protein n=1 Tax=Elysia crispata TaxID=231223 RepID=A0AAE1AQH0_9GAST|nr:hypothetical protein RRG08_035476 [Elysia crispata]
MVVTPEAEDTDKSNIRADVSACRCCGHDNDEKPRKLSPDSDMIRGTDQPNMDKDDCTNTYSAPPTDEDRNSLPNLGTNDVSGDINTEVETQESEYFEQSPKAPDGGYGWFIVLGSFLVQFLIGGLGRSDGLFFLMFESRYQQSATLTAWPGAVAGMLRLGMGPIASAICQRWSVRTCCLFGGLALGLSHIVTAFSPNFPLVLVFNGFVQGIARGLVYGPSLILVTMYFDSRRSFATGISTSGVGAGTFVLVPLVQFLFDTYGFTGGFLVLSAICLHTLVMAMLSRPLYLHYKFTGQKSQYSNMKEKPERTEMVRFSEKVVAANSACTNSARLQNDVCIYQDTDEEASQDLMQHKQAAVHIHHKKFPNSPTSHQTTESGFWKSTLDILFPRENLHRSFEGHKKQKTRLFHFALLRDPAFLGLCFSIGVFTAAFKAVFAFLPALAQSCGLTSSQAVFILSISGAVDTVGRILFGFLLDRSFVRKRRLAVYCCLLFLLAVVSASMPSLGGNFVGLCVTSSLFGLLAGVLASQKSVICVDLLGAERMPNAFGILLLFQAIGMGLGPLLFGACKDALGRFQEAYYLGAGLLAAAACLMLYSTFVHTLSKRRNAQQHNPAC